MIDGKFNLDKMNSFISLYFGEYNNQRVWSRESRHRLTSGGSRIFPGGGGAPTPKIAIIFHIFAENCMKMKEFGPPGGACVPGAPLDPPMLTIQCNRVLAHLHVPQITVPLQCIKSIKNRPVGPELL